MLITNGLLSIAINANTSVLIRIKNYILHERIDAQALPKF